MKTVEREVWWMDENPESRVTVGMMDTMIENVQASMAENKLLIFLKLDENLSGRLENVCGLIKKLWRDGAVVRAWIREIPGSENSRIFQEVQDTDSFRVSLFIMLNRDAPYTSGIKGAHCWREYGQIPQY